MAKWIVDDRPIGVLVRPVDDIVLHTYTAECVCQPVVQMQGRTCTCTGWPGKAQVRLVITHQAMDGRE